MTQAPARRRSAAAWLVAALLPLAAPSAACAAAGPWAEVNGVRARLIAPVQAAGDVAALPAGLEIRLAEGWKTYWRTPGEAGLPPAFDWADSDNVAAVAVRYPAPERFDTLGIDTVGYRGSVVLPLEVRPQRPGGAVVLRGAVDLLVCSAVCVPTHLPLALELPDGPGLPDPEPARLLALAQSRVPDDGSVSDIAVRRAAPVADAAELIVEASARRPFGARPDVFVEADGWSFGAPSVATSAGGAVLTARVPVLSGPRGATAPAPGTPLTITVADGPRAAEARVAAAPPAGTGFAAALGLALLGGLILNLMPCVLPVLSLKLLAVLGQHGRERRRVRLALLATAAGIIASMLAIGGALAGLKAAGTVVGWGMQFQQPAFLAAMAALLTALAVNLAGGFEFALPSALTTRLGTLGGDGLAGSFAMGAFATLLATPCSAPFLGTAVGYALARGAGEILAVFAALGLGLAAPHLLAALVPALTRLLPRPGRWMLRLRTALALPLVATAVWLLAVLAAQTSAAAAAATGAALVGLAVALALQSRRGGARRVAPAALAALLTLGAIAAPIALPGAAGASAAAIGWTAFDEAALPSLIAEGRTVFIDATADWCLTCIANERLVLSRARARAALARTVTMRADWTRPDERIAAFLARHGRYGIPFAVVYGPATPDGLVLPELLTEDAVVEAIHRASGAPGRSFR